MSEIDGYEAELELALYREYRDVVKIFRYVVETERRFYLANDVDVKVRSSTAGDVFFEVNLSDAWVWDIYRTSRFIRSVRVVTFKDVNIEELNQTDITRELDLPGSSL
ncbi:DUF2469 domain-containing protein [Actinotignum sanguinis]|uniref:Protein often found in actinomycetes clustered with signal peptidase and/or RNaseHII n=3 Tax=Actinomycetaceae TaxID=2049 RepID=S2VHK3_9ACTO|nr:MULTISPECIES: DUF2469 domain-containing protein [Actinotignum]WPJ89371.1 DUF2469 domain-containing protein [Schaalia turicensis]EPD26913.1 hypothetical protein HMPREF9237_00847 [Actinotignum schaalii FB123-CNA-2]MDE1552373.1 DUF2469 domain-containing protein [Actinotignum sanguinis]MDE1566003.1 DUF2469 domain-containing protein [Actinotignum sanguinis]MDE1577236.1 DUF2469 domain-containing protein [Actinotignum sanguinis]